MPVEPAPGQQTTWPEFCGDMVQGPASGVYAVTFMLIGVKQINEQSIRVCLEEPLLKGVRAEMRSAVMCEGALREQLAAATRELHELGGIGVSASHGTQPKLCR